MDGLSSSCQPAANLDGSEAGFTEAWTITPPQMGEVKPFPTTWGSSYPSFLPAANRSLRTHRFIWGRSLPIRGFIDGPPELAVEVRSEGDYGPAAEEEKAAKRADYFEAGTRIVWDVDPVAELIHVYRAESPKVEQTYLRDQIGDAEPILPGWRVDLNWIFG
jgi:Uma2 family endonuclease